MSKAQQIKNILEDFGSFIKYRISSYFNEANILDEAQLKSRFFPEEYQLLLNEFFQPHKLKYDEQAIVLLALAPNLQPDFYDNILAEVLPEEGNFPQFGFSKGYNFRAYLPTGDTALFLLAFDDIEKRMNLRGYFNEDHLFAKYRMLWLEEVQESEPISSGKIILAQDYIDLLTTGKISPPKFNLNFPAQLLETVLEWKDLVLRAETVEQLKEIESWLKHSPKMLNDDTLKKIIKPGYRVLFHGPPGTGKTLTATLLGKFIGQPVYRIDLSMVISKFIGETEKNLANLFSKAENKDWILFFDEADALFGKRTNVRDAHDKYANQEVSYLLQRIEMFKGLVILATNFKGNIDNAFVRRFQSIIYFPIPDAEERYRIWVNSMPSSIPLSPEVNLRVIAQKYELTGSEIINIIQNTFLRSQGNSTGKIELEHLMEGIKNEYQKDGRILR